jgi:AcrR family transcriptional regulator
VSRPARRPGRDDALAAVRRILLKGGGRIEMQTVAEQLGVNRVTLYRWVGTRDEVVVEVLWDLTERLIGRWWQELVGLPGSRVPAVLAHWVQETVSTPGMREFLHGESQWAMRLLTLRVGGFQPRLLALVGELIAADVAEGRVATPLSLDELAYTVVRVCESYIYLPAITGEPVDPHVLERVLRVLLPATGQVTPEAEAPGA